MNNKRNSYNSGNARGFRSLCQESGQKLNILTIPQCAVSNTSKDTRRCQLSYKTGGSANCLSSLLEKQFVNIVKLRLVKSFIQQINYWE